MYEYTCRLRLLHTNIILCYTFPKITYIVSIIKHNKTAIKNCKPVLTFTPCLTHTRILIFYFCFCCVPCISLGLVIGKVQVTLRLHYTYTTHVTDTLPGDTLQSCNYKYTLRVWHTLLLYRNIILSSVNVYQILIVYIVIKYTCTSPAQRIYKVLACFSGKSYCVDQVSRMLKFSVKITPSIGKVQFR